MAENPDETVIDLPWILDVARICASSFLRNTGQCPFTHEELMSIVWEELTKIHAKGLFDRVDNKRRFAIGCGMKACKWHSIKFYYDQEQLVDHREPRTLTEEEVPDDYEAVFRAWVNTSESRKHLPIRTRIWAYLTYVEGWSPEEISNVWRFKVMGSVSGISPQAVKASIGNLNKNCRERKGKKPAMAKKIVLQIDGEAKEFSSVEEMMLYAAPICDINFLGKFKLEIPLIQRKMRGIHQSPPEDVGKGAIQGVPGGKDG